MRPRTIVAAADPLARAGLVALLAIELDVVASIGLGGVRMATADAVVLDLGATVAVPDDGTPLLALVMDSDGARRAIAGGARGVLARDADGPRIARGVHAVIDGMFVLDEPFAAALLPEVLRVDGVALTAREGEVLSLLAEGLSNKEIAARLAISDHTAKFHVRAILTKLGAQTRTEAVVLAARSGRLLL